MSNIILLSDFPGLPKWPMMYTTGVPVMIHQAEEIIRRTDYSLNEWFGGNDYFWRKEVQTKLGQPIELSYEEEKEMSGALKATIYTQKLNEMQVWREKWNSIRTDYVTNSWVSCSYIYGPHGWCHPDGQIGFVDNIGKWPSVEAVVEDWKVLCDAFPFLDVAVTLYDGEFCEDSIKPVISIVVKNGTVECVAPIPDIHAKHPVATRGNRFKTVDEAYEVLADFRTRAKIRECGIPGGWIGLWADHAKALGLVKVKF